MRFSRPVFRRLLVISSVGLLAIALLWGGLWWLAARQYHSVIDEWVTEGRAAGDDITYDTTEEFGFPRHVVVRFTNLRWKNPDGISFHADDMDLASTPWSWRSFDARFKGDVRLAAPVEDPAKALFLEGLNGHAHVNLDENGVWSLTHIWLADAKAGRQPDLICRAESLEVSAQRPAKPPKDHTDTGLTLMARAEKLTLPDGMGVPFGPKMDLFDAALRVMGAVPDFRKKDSVAVWNNGSGVVEFDDLRVRWGILHLAAKGTIGFDDDLQPEGAFSSTITDHHAVVTTMMEQNLIPQRQAAMLNSALNLFSKSVNATSIDLPITIQLGGLFIGPVRVYAYAPIDWPVTVATPGSVAPAAPPAAAIAAPSTALPATEAAPAASPGPASAETEAPRAPAQETAPVAPEPTGNATGAP